MFHVKHFLDDTVCAVATPIGVGGIGVIRVSGPNALDLTSCIIKGFPQEVLPRYVYHGWVCDRETTFDEVLFFYMRAPNSYTGEDVVEISCHGGIVVCQKVIDLLVKQGARVALPGEFTKRAFLNGKIDLVQAEAVLDIITAKSECALIQASALLEGKLSGKIKTLRSRLLNLLAAVEVQIDFSDDVEPLDFSAFSSEVDKIANEILRLLSSADEGRILREGVRSVIIGKPNVGKSSLLNALLGEDRAIVTCEPGTTRDTIEEVLCINGFPFLLVDTAGIRSAQGEAETSGVERAMAVARRADLLLAVFDASNPMDYEDIRILELIKGQPTIFVLNKVDLGFRFSFNGFHAEYPSLKVSALTGVGIEELKEKMVGIVCGNGLSAVGEGVINARQKELLHRALESLIRVKESMAAGLPEDFIAIDLKASLVALGEVCGEEVSDEVLNTIFDQFCVGK